MFKYCLVKYRLIAFIWLMKNTAGNVYTAFSKLKCFVFTIFF